MKIWTVGNNPWVMGGRVKYVCMADVPVAGPVDLGKGYQGYVAVSPSGYVCVVESETGAIVGHDVAEVKQDIETGDDAVMRKQIADARKMLETWRCETVTAEEFWKRLRK